MKKVKKGNQAKWAGLLVDAVNKTGSLLPAYSAFHPYSIGNQILAMCQCFQRDVAVTPINTYNGWKKLGRQVKKGAKAIELCMPVTRKVKAEEKDNDQPEHAFTQFIFRKNWFLLSDTEGEEVEPLKTPDFDIKKAMKKLSIEEITFELPNGNCQGYAIDDEIAVSPIAALPHKTRFHEMAHIILGHTAERKMVDSKRTPKNIKEDEAESVAYILCSFLELEGAEYSRGYIQHWLNGKEIPEKSAQKIFASADKILKAGQL